MLEDLSRRKERLTRRRRTLEPSTRSALLKIAVCDLVLYRDAVRRAQALAEELAAADGAAGRTTTSTGSACPATLRTTRVDYSEVSDEERACERAADAPRHALQIGRAAAFDHGPPHRPHRSAAQRAHCTMARGWLAFSARPPRRLRRRSPPAGSL